MMSGVEILAPAFVAGIMIVMTHVPMGIAVLRRRVVFLDLAIAQFAGIGGIAITYLFLSPPGWMVQAGALAVVIIGYGHY